MNINLWTPNTNSVAEKDFTLKNQGKEDENINMDSDDETFLNFKRNISSKPIAPNKTHFRLNTDGLYQKKNISIDTRVLICKDSPGKVNSNQILFDSSYFYELDGSDHPLSPEPQPKLYDPLPKHFSQIIFGTVPYHIQKNGMNTKMHIVKKEIILTKLFSINSREVSQIAGKLEGVKFSKVLSYYKEGIKLPPLSEFYQDETGQLNSNESESSSQFQLYKFRDTSEFSHTKRKSPLGPFALCVIFNFSRLSSNEEWINLCIENFCVSLFPLIERRLNIFLRKAEKSVLRTIRMNFNRADFSSIHAFFQGTNDSSFSPRKMLDQTLNSYCLQKDVTIVSSFFRFYINVKRIFVSNLFFLNQNPRKTKERGPSSLTSEKHHSEIELIIPYLRSTVYKTLFHLNQPAFNSRKNNFFFSSFMTALLSLNLGWMKWIINKNKEHFKEELIPASNFRPCEYNNNKNIIKKETFDLGLSSQLRTIFSHFNCTTPSDSHNRIIIISRKKKILKSFVAVVEYFLRNEYFPLSSESESKKEKDEEEEKGEEKTKNDFQEHITELIRATKFEKSENEKRSCGYHDEFPTSNKEPLIEYVDIFEKEENDSFFNTKIPKYFNNNYFNNNIIGHPFTVLTNGSYNGDCTLVGVCNKNFDSQKTHLFYQELLHDLKDWGKNPINNNCRNPESSALIVDLNELSIEQLTYSKDETVKGIYNDIIMMGLHIVPIQTSEYLKETFEKFQGLSQFDITDEKLMFYLEERLENLLSLYTLLSPLLNTSQETEFANITKSFGLGKGDFVFLKKVHQYWRVQPEI